MTALSSSSFPAPVQSLLTSFTIQKPMLLSIAQHMHLAFQQGLTHLNHSLKMIPSFVTHLPTGEEQGMALVVDLGGTNLRVCSIELKGHRESVVQQQQFVIPEEMKHGSGQALFTYVAQCVQQFLISHPLTSSSSSCTSTDQKQQPKYKMGFTFSFPVKQISLNHGTLIHWNKGFLCSDVIGMDVVQLLQEKLDALDLNIVITALINDTIGTLAAHCYVDPTTKMGVILGTGSNAAYVEKISNIKKMPDLLQTTVTTTTTSPNLTAPSSSPPSPPSSCMLINTEWGAFDCEKQILPINDMDELLNQHSVHPGFQRYEKMMSGAYLGELTRLSILKLIEQQCLFQKIPKEVLQASKLMHQGEFDTAFMSEIESDSAPLYPNTSNLLQTQFQLPTSLITQEDFSILTSLVHTIALRAAHLSAAGLVALLHQTELPNHQPTTIAIDGSVWRKYPGFQSMVAKALKELLGEEPCQYIQLKSAIDGSAIGAAVVAFLAN